MSPKLVMKIPKKDTFSEMSIYHVIFIIKVGKSTIKNEKEKPRFSNTFSKMLHFQK